MWQIYSQGPSEHKPFKILGENLAWVYPGTAPIFWIPPVISGMGKATNFKLGRYIHRIHANKNPLKIWEKRSVGEFMDSPNF